MSVATKASTASSIDRYASSGPTGDSAIPVSTFIETLLDDADEATARTTLGAAADSGAGTLLGYASSSAVATGTTALPGDNTTPQNTEGDQYLSVTVTPTDANADLVIDVLLFIAHGSGTNVTAALFQDSTAGALAAGLINAATVDAVYPLRLRHKMKAGGTAATTFKVRAGGNSGGTLTINGSAGAGLLNGALFSSIEVREYRP